MSVSIVIPVYHAEGTLRELYRQIVGTATLTSGPLEIIFVEDDGDDGSWSIIEELAADSRVRGIKLNKNYGQHNALLCGIRAARNLVVVTMDDDLQNPVDEIQALLAKLSEGYDLVYGTPKRKEHGLARNLATFVTKWVMQSAFGVKNIRHVSAFRAFHVRLRGAFAEFRGPAVSIDVLLTWGTSNFGYVEVDHEPRKIGVSGYTTRKLIAHAVNLLTGYSTVPLRVASVLGLGFTVFGIAVLAWVVGRHFFGGGDAVPGFPFLASIIALFSGVQLFALGVIGEYLARMYFRSMEQPPYVIREELNG
jgi:glycosyltransferase involved in cell wall biosynthesis